MRPALQPLFNKAYSGISIPALVPPSKNPASAGFFINYQISPDVRKHDRFAIVIQ